MLAQKSIESDAGLDPVNCMTIPALPPSPKSPTAKRLLASDNPHLRIMDRPPVRTAELLRRLPSLSTGGHLRVAGVEHFRGRTIEAEPLGGEVPFEVDGEPLGRLPIRVEAGPGVLSIVGAAAGSGTGS